MKKFCGWETLFSEHSHAVLREYEDHLFFFFFFLECNCWSYGVVELMTDRAYANWWTCIIAMQFNKIAHDSLVPSLLPYEVNHSYFV